jgi:hypothetical protein
LITTKRSVLGILAKSGCWTEEFVRQTPGKPIFWTDWVAWCSEVIENMVARDGVELYSGIDSLEVIDSNNSYNA